MLPLSGQVYDALEIFAGVATLSRCLRLGGLNVASLDIGLWNEYAQARNLPAMKNPMDLCTPAGMACPGLEYEGTEGGMVLRWLHFLVKSPTMYI